MQIDSRDVECTLIEDGKQDYGRFWAAIFALKSAAGISMHLQECFWYNGSEKRKFDYRIYEELING